MRKTILIAVVVVGIICAALISYGLFTQRDVIPTQNLAIATYRVSPKDMTDVTRFIPAMDDLTLYLSDSAPSRSSTNMPESR